MATRIDIEVTSDRGDGSFTWRAAGAKQPKGVFDASLLPAGAGVGDVLKAEAEFSVDGPELTSLVSPKAPKADTVERLTLISGGNDEGGVTTQLARKSRGSGRGRDRGRGRGDSRGRDDSRGGSRGGPRGRGGSRGPRQPSVRPRRDHREAWIATLPETRRPIAEQLMHEGRDGVKAALERQNRVAVEAGGDAFDIGPALKIADDLQPGLALAEWLDQADAAVADVDRANLGELRKIVIAGDAWADNSEASTRQRTLRSKLQARLDKDQAGWLREIREAMAEDRLARALRLTGRPVRVGVPLPDDLVESLTAATTEALSPDEDAEAWTPIIDALASSPLRHLVRPEAGPDSPDEDLLDLVDRVAHRIPAIAKLFGIEVKPRERRRR